MRNISIDRLGAAGLALGAWFAAACGSGAGTSPAATSTPIVCPAGQAFACSGAAGGPAGCACQPVVTPAAGSGGAAGILDQSSAGGALPAAGTGGGRAAGGGGSLAGEGSLDSGLAGRDADRGAMPGGRGAAGTTGSGGAPAAGSGGASSAGGQGPDNCTDTPVSGLALAEIAVYQSVKVAIMKGMAPVAAGQRNADLVQGRDAMFRIHVTPQAGWTARMVSARVELADGAGAAPRRFYALLSPARASVDDDAETAFRVRVPADAMTANANYSVSLVECTATAPVGPVSAARFPSDGAAPLGAVQTGPLRIHLLPLVTGGRMPEVSQMLMDTYEKRLMAMYPITSVEFTVGEPLPSSASSMCNHLTAIRSRRAADRAPIDLYYYGLTTGLSGGQAGCSTATPNANTASKTSAGWANATGNQGRLEGGAATITHEIGHAHGRLHAPCMVQDPDRAYPYANADIGVWAYDSRSDKFLPPMRKDMMSYCPNPDRSGAWLSDYTYQALLKRVSAVNALVPQALVLPGGAAPAPWQTLVVDSTGTTWGEYTLMAEGTPEGVPMTAIVHGEHGPLQTIQVYREDLEDGVSEHPYLLTVPERRPDWHAIEVPGLLAPHPFP